MRFLWIGVGGALGTLLRFGVDISLAPFARDDTFPYHTMLVNWVGCFFLAWFYSRLRQFPSLSPYLAPAIGTGLLGSFTTFSTFSAEMIHLLMNHRFFEAFGYGIATLWGGLFFTWLATTLNKETRI